MSYYHFTKKTPDLNEIVIVSVDQISEGGIYCRLVEYKNLQGFILNSEIGKSYVNPKKIFTQGELYPCIVIGIDNEKETLDLSYKKVKSDKNKNNVNEKELIMNEYKFREKLFKLAKEMNEITKLPIEMILDNTSRKFAVNKKINASYEIFYKAVLEDTSLFVHEFKDPSYQEDVSKFIDNLKSRITSTHMTMKQDFSLVVYDVNGVQKLKQILTNNIDSNKECEINHIAAPKYEILVSFDTEQECKNKIESILNKIKDNIDSTFCKFQILGTPEIVKQKICTLKPLYHSEQ